MSNAERFWLGVAIALGVLVRLVPVLTAAGPLGDGGLIHAMVDDIRAGGLPEVASYNGQEIPFVYPPAALLMGAGIGAATGADTLDLLRVLPPTLSIGCLAAFAWLAWRLLPPIAAIGAAFAYALIPHAYDWVIAGGGLTRGLGLLAALVAMGVAAGRPSGTLRHPVVAGVALGIAILSHPQAAILGIVGCLVLSWSRPLLPWARNGAIAGAVAILVVLPWLAWVAATHGLGALVSPANRFEPLVGLLRLGNLHFSGAPFMDVFAVVGVVGVLVAVVRGPRRIPLLLLLVYMLGAGGGEFLGAVPWALVSGIGMAAIVDEVAAATERPIRRTAILLTGGLALFLALIGTLGAAADGSSKLHRLSADHHVAMEWLRDDGPEGASVIVPTAGVWGDDEISEWLPALAQRHSIGTVQGSEWLGRAAFEESLAVHNAIRDCTGDTVECYAEIDPDALLFVPKGQLGGPFSPGDCCPGLRATLEAAGYEVLYDGPGATIAAP